MVPMLTVRWCSTIFKQAIITAWAQSRGLVTHALGIGADESQRWRQADHLNYPLIDWGWSRRDCIDYIRGKVVPIPRKSGCFFCPSQKRSEWRELLDVHPDLYERASAMERNASRNGHRATLDVSGKYSLDMMRHQFESQGPSMFEDQDIPRIYEPCICHI